MLKLLIYSLLPAALRAAACTSSFKDMWASVPTGQNAYIVEMKDGVSPERPQGDGNSFFSYCLPKGANGKPLNPFVETKLHRSMFWQFGKLGCKAETELLGMAPSRRSLESSSGEADVPTQATSACASYTTKYADVCTYPGPPAGLELIPDRDSQQNSWYGPLLQVPNVNGEDLNDKALDSTEQIKHTTIQGITGATSCTKTEGDRTMTFYDGGVMGEIRRSPSLVYRSFQFKKPSDRAAAIAVSTDTVNPGLKYAHSFAGLNGCSIEIVLEVSIKPGGGAEVTGSFPLESMALQRELAVRGSVAVCKTSQEIVALAGIKALRESQNVDYDASCETGYREILRFSRTFICKATGKSVEASFEFETKKGAATTISSDCNEPTPYNTNADPASGMVLHQAASFKMILDASQAPESCGAMYWDPLLSPLDFGTDPNSTSTSGSGTTSGTDTTNGLPSWALALIIGGGVIVIAGGAWLKCKKTNTKAKGSQSV